MGTGKNSLSTENDEGQAHFSVSKAKSFYFVDSACNIVEYTARYETTPEALEQQFKRWIRLKLLRRLSKKRQPPHLYALLIHANLFI